MKIRDFEFPQTLGTLHPFYKSFKHTRRTLRDIFPEQLLGDTENFLRHAERTITFKLQKLLYITRDNSPASLQKLSECIKTGRILRPCHYLTVARFMLADLSVLPSWVKNSDYIIAVCGQDSLRISVSHRTVEIVSPCMSINPEIPVMVETDSI